MRFEHRKYRMFWLMTLFFCQSELTFAQQANPVYSSYNGQSVLWGTQSVTLTAGFNIPTGNSVLIHVKDDPAPSNPFSNERNYVLKTTYLQPYSNTIESPALTQASQTINYYDRLGRLEQSIDIKGSPTQKDVVHHVEYDATGAKSIDYLPYTTTANGSGFYKTNAKSAQLSFYTSNLPVGQTANSHPYSKSILDRSPLNRVIEQGSTGAVWQPKDAGIANSGHTIKTELALNNTVALTDIVNTRSVVLYNVTLSATNVPTLVRNGVYSAKQLSVVVTKDEDWKIEDGRIGTNEEYKDKDGRTILKRTFNKIGTQIEMLSTYYVYDDWGNLTYVLPPGARPDSTVVPNSTLLNQYAYQYIYDNLGRTVEQRVPGKGVEYFVYNKNNQLVAKQNTVQRSRNEWSVSKYDALGRVIIEGLWTNNNTAISRISLQNQLDGQTQLWETKTTSGHGYTSTAWPTTINSYYNVNYYDTYSVPGLPASYAYQAYAGNIKIDKAPGQPTVSKTWPINDGNNTLWEVYYYDLKGRNIQVHSANHLGGKDILSYSYDFAGKLLTTQHNHTSSGGQSVTTLKTFGYDHAGRLLSSKQKTGSDAEIVVAHHTYNETGQLIDKKLHQKSGQSKYLQSIDYRYNERGWLRSINDENLGANTTSNQDDATTAPDLFGMSISYNTGAKPQFNGNISATQWKTSKVASMSTAPPKMGYELDYDAIGQLINAGSITNGVKDGNHSEFIRYDRQGNVTRIGRWAYTGGGKRQIDSLVFTYTGNKHSRIDDISTAPASAKNLGFYDQVQQANEYTYDNNGNVIKDLNKGILSINYNVFDLPQTVTFSTSPVKKIEFTYDRRGNKLQRKFTDGANIYTTDYVNGVQYEQGQLAFIHNDEGRVRKVGTSYSYEYDIRDYLGSARVTFAADATDVTQTTVKVLQQNAYYPYGLAMYGDAASGLYLSFVSGSKNMYLYSGKELQEQGGLGWYDHGSRMYDPVIGRWSVTDPAYQFASPYMAMGNNPIVYADPNGELAWFVVPLIGAAVGGTANLASKFITGDIHSFRDGFAAFGIGAVAGAVGTFTGGAAVSAAGLGALSIGGGAVAGLASSATAGPILGIGNMVYFGDPYSPEAFAQGLVFGAFTGGLTGGLGNIIGGKGLNIWTGLQKGGKISIEPIIMGDILDEQGQSIGRFQSASVGGGQAAKTGKSLLSAGELARIENAATRIGKPINMVGSRASGTAKATSDWDYVIEGLTNKQWKQIKNSLPGAPSRIDNLPRMIDIFKGPVDPTKPFITIFPK